ncbi:hypothetical protein EPA93_02940 [Ktedonosporobacter rubrisoli]|uniref:Glycosyltransferase family 2 protein n=1 Tax=Ktedonosporobacter rubrisoli TaxID=2509675 RepID=A0A4P6JIU3_KTERU|nr:hypothetical protein [Ktedonosporobacter rubrisoli]QBD75004.1 hypothetical protein EPA93_02940 [Ktedonosporobacter rubrisoli]
MQTGRTLRFFICTRNRPETLERCINSIAVSCRRAFPGLQAHCYVFDDSTEEDASNQIRALCARKTFPELVVSLITNVEKEKFLKYLIEQAPHAATFLATNCKQLGKGSWDAAGLRNVTLLYACLCSSEEDLLIFLDDDISLQTLTYQGHLLSVDGAQALQEMNARVAARAAVAVGAGYIGRFDGAVYDHLGDLLAQIEEQLSYEEGITRAGKTLEALMGFPDVLPIRISLSAAMQDEEDAYGAGIIRPEISGAALATTRAAICSHHFPRCYNEDWIWLALLGEQDDALQKIATDVIHAPPSQFSIRPEFFLYQNGGDVLYAAVRRALEYRPDSYNRIAWCQEHFSVQHVQQALEDRIAWMEKLLHKVSILERFLQDDHRKILWQPEEAGALVHTAQALRGYIEYAVDFMSETPVAYWFDMLSNYFADIALWRKIMQIASSR